jgi:moderate conductance mechanosensitive channel
MVGASLSVNVAYKEDTDGVSQALKDIAAEMRQDPGILGQIECAAAGCWSVQREFNRLVKEALTTHCVGPW